MFKPGQVWSNDTACPLVWPDKEVGGERFDGNVQGNPIWKTQDAPVIDFLVSK